MADKKMYKVGITVKEPWSADISYEVLDITLYAVENGGDGCSYIAIRANQGVTPGTDDTVWVKATQRGQSIYDLAVKYGDFEGTEAEFEAEYEAAVHAAQSAAQSASDIEAQVETNEAARVAAETARSDAERARSSAETARINAENARDDAEGLRDTAESDRVRAEAGRVTAEASRVEAETFRQGAEQSRRQQFEGLKTDMETAIDNVDAKSAEIAEDIEGYEANEAGRVSAENARVTAESARVSAEQSRVSAEQGRATAETARQTAEGNRATAETERASAEGARTTAEQGRVSAESGRVSAESERVAAETARESASATAVQNAETATAAANTAAEHAEEAAATIDEKIAEKADQSEVSQLGLEVYGEEGSTQSIVYDRTAAINYSINSSGKWAAMNKSVLIPITSGRVYNITGDSQYETIVGVVNTIDNIANGVLVDWATGWTSRLKIAANAEYEFTAPSDGHYLSVLIKSSNGELYPTVTETIPDVKGLSERMDDAEADIDALEGRVTPLESASTQYGTDITDLQGQVGSFILEGKYWSRGSSAWVTLSSASVYIIPVSAAKKIQCVQESGTCHLGFLVSYDTSNTDNTVFAGDYTNTIEINSGSYHDFDIPIDTKYIYVSISYGGINGPATLIIDGYDYLAAILDNTPLTQSKSSQQRAAISADGINRTLPIFRYKSANILAGESLQCVIALVGDSWTQHNATGPNYVTPLAAALRDKYGDAGIGLYSFSMSSTSGTLVKMGCCVAADASDTRADAEYFTYRDEDSGCKWVDAADTTFLEGAWLELAINKATTKIVLYYLATSGAGTFTYSVDGGTAVSVDADNSGSDTLMSIELDVASGTHTLRIDQVSGSTMIFGADLQNADTGVRIHKIANKGALSEAFADVDATLWCAEITALGIDTATILLGTNDANQGSVSTFHDNMLAICDNLRTAVPYVDIALVCPSNSTLREMDSYDESLTEIALHEGYGYINLQPLFGSVEQINALGTFQDSVHPTQKSGRMIARYIFSKLFD